jgi:hypothetical protein
VTATNNLPTIEIADAGDARRVLVTLFWQPPGAGRTDRASLAAVLPAP